MEFGNVRLHPGTSPGEQPSEGLHGLCHALTPQTICGVPPIQTIPDHCGSPQHRPSDGVPQHRPSWTIHGVPPNIPALAAALGCSRAQWGWSHPLAPTSISSTTTLG